MEHSSNSSPSPRRNFLKTAVAITAGCAVAPSLALGKLMPIRDDSGEVIQGIFSLDISSTPELASDNGSVLVEVPGLPNNFKSDLAVSPFTRQSKIIISRITEGNFVALSARCTHNGTTVDAYSASKGHIFCNAHGSKFHIDGKIKTPVIAGQPGLQKFTATFDVTTNILLVEIPGYVPSAVNEEAVLTMNTAELSPNPCNEFALLSFSLPKESIVSIEVLFPTGQVIRKIIEGSVGEGDQTFRIDTRSFSSGVFLVAVRINGSNPVSKTLTVSK